MRQKERLYGTETMGRHARDDEKGPEEAECMITTNGDGRSDVSAHLVSKQ
jgi:hypothetical protein